MGVDNARGELKHYIAANGFNQADPQQFQLENQLATAQAELYAVTGEITLSESRE
jgi:hypothetical protein